MTALLGCSLPGSLDRPAARLARIDVAPVAAAGAGGEQGEGVEERRVVRVHPVAEPAFTCGWKPGNVGANAAQRDAQRDVDHVVAEPPAVRVAGGVAAEQAEPALQARAATRARRS